MRGSIRASLTGILSIFYVYCHAQAVAEQFSFRHLTEKNGLSYNIVNCIIKDRFGFIWMGTYDGLNRFDGFHFTVYKNNRKDSSTLINNTVHQVCEDNEGNIWAATEAGISCYHHSTGKFENYPLKNIAGPGITGNILCGSNGKIWATGKGGLLEFVLGTKSFRVYPHNSADLQSLSSDNIYKNGLLEDPLQKGLWIATAKGLNFFDYRSKSFVNFYNNTNGQVFNNHSVSALSAGSNQTILYADNDSGQLIRLNGKDLTIHAIPLSRSLTRGAEIATTLEDRRGNYWICSWSYNLLIIDGKNTQRQLAFRHDDAKPNSVNGDFFWAAKEDAEGTVWLGTVGGISYTNPLGKIFKEVDLDTKINSLKNSGGITALEVDDDQTYWVGTNNSGLLHYFPKGDSIETFDMPFASGEARGSRVSVKALAVSKEKIFAGTNNGTWWFDKQRKRFSTMPGIAGNDPLQKNFASYIVRQNDSLIWIRSYNSGVHRFNEKTKTWKHIGERIGADPTKGYIRNIFVDNNTRLWAFIVPESLAWFDEKKQLFVVESTGNKRMFDGNGFFADVCIDKQNKFWIADKGAGLVMYDPSTGDTKTWSESEGLAINHILAVQVDDHGNVWCAGYNKLSMFDPVANNIENFSFQISPSNYSYVNRFAKQDDGKLICSINSTLIVIDPSQLHGHKKPRTTLINGLRVFDQQKNIDPATQTISLKHYENFITIDYGILTNSDAGRYRFMYKLEGYDRSWIEAGAATSAAYTNLPGGNYVFHVKALSAQEQWESSETLLSIEVVPPFYKTTWFYALLTLFFAALIFSMIRYRIHNIRKAAIQKNELNKMMNEWQLKALRSQMNPHFIFNCLNSIDNYILHNNEELASRYLNKFSRLIRLILNQSDTNITTVAREVEMLRYYMELECLRFDEPFTFSIEIAGDIDQEETEIPSMLLQPYVENAILHGLKHSDRKGKLRINISAEDDMLVCMVEDNGVGRKRAAEIKATRPELHTSKGLGITEQRLNILRETGENSTAVIITDLADSMGRAKGTRVVIRVPYEKD